MRYLEVMSTVTVELPSELVLAAGWNINDLSSEAAAVLALDLYRQNKVSLGRAAQLCNLPMERFMQVAAQHNVALHYGTGDLEDDRRTLERLGL